MITSNSYSGFVKISLKLGLFEWRQNLFCKRRSLPLCSTPLQIHDVCKEPLKGRMCWRTKQKKTTCNVSMAVFLSLSDYTGSSKS